MSVLNLVINGLPSIQNAKELYKTSVVVLNLVINGLPSILLFEVCDNNLQTFGFKPCYKWITFNTV